MAFSDVVKCLIIVYVTTIVAGLIDTSFDDDEAKGIGKEINVVLVPSKAADGIDQSNGTGQVFDDNESNESSTTSAIAIAPTSAETGHKYPIQLGQWMVIGCHNDHESWGCDLRRMMRTATVGFIDTLRFTMRKDNSLKMAAAKERCNDDYMAKNVKTFRVVVDCPKKRDGKDGCNENVLQRLKVAYFQAGFLCAIAVILASLLCFACLAKAADGGKRRPTDRVSIKLVSKQPVPPAKW